MILLKLKLKNKSKRLQNNNTFLLLQQNKTTSIRFETLEKICIALDCTPNDIIKIDR